MKGLLQVRVTVVWPAEPGRLALLGSEDSQGHEVSDATHGIRECLEGLAVIVTT